MVEGVLYVLLMGEGLSPGYLPSVMASIGEYMLELAVGFTHMLYLSSPYACEGFKPDPKRRKTVPWYCDCGQAICN